MSSPWQSDCGSDISDPDPDPGRASDFLPIQFNPITSSSGTRERKSCRPPKGIGHSALAPFWLPPQTPFQQVAGIQCTSQLMPNLHLWAISSHIFHILQYHKEDQCLCHLGANFMEAL